MPYHDSVVGIASNLKEVGVVPATAVFAVAVVMLFLAAAGTVMMMLMYMSRMDICTGDALEKECHIPVARVAAGMHIDSTHRQDVEHDHHEGENLSYDASVSHTGCKSSNFYTNCLSLPR